MNWTSGVVDCLLEILGPGQEDGGGQLSEEMPGPDQFIRAWPAVGRGAGSIKMITGGNLMNLSLGCWALIKIIRRNDLIKHLGGAQPDQMIRRSSLSSLEVERRGEFFFSVLSSLGGICLLGAMLEIRVCPSNLSLTTLGLAWLGGEEKILGSISRPLLKTYSCVCFQQLKQ